MNKLLKHYIVTVLLVARTVNLCLLKAQSENGGSLGMDIFPKERQLFSFLAN